MDILQPIDCLARMNDCLGSLIIVSNLEFLDSSAMVFISSYRNITIRSTRLAYSMQVATTQSCSLPFKKLSRPVSVIKHCRPIVYLPTNIFMDLSPSSNTLTFFRCPQTVFCLLCVLRPVPSLFSRMVVSKELLNIWCRKLSMLN